MVWMRQRPGPHSWGVMVALTGFSRFNIGSSGQQIHINEGTTDPTHSRHPCFKLGSRDELETLKKAIHEHHVRGGRSAPMAADKPGEMDSGE